MTQRTKVCGQCQEVKSLDEFYNVRSRPDKKHLYCKACCKLNHRACRVKKREKRQRYSKKYYQRHKDAYRQRYEKRKRMLILSSPAPAAKGKAGSSAFFKATTRHTRRAKAAGTTGDSTISTSELYKRDKGICALCKGEVLPSEASIDHIIPISKGGAHIWDNVQLTHLKCNLSKGARH